MQSINRVAKRRGEDGIEAGMAEKEVVGGLF